MGSITVVSGASRSGKSKVVDTLINNNLPTVIYDSKCDESDYQCLPFTYEFSDFLAAVEKSEIPRIRLMDRKQLFFNLFCRVALLKQHKNKMELNIVVEELANLVGQGKARGDWGTLVRTGMSGGMNLIGVTQSPSESDKTILSNATAFITFASPREDDRKYISNYLSVSGDDIKALNQYEYYFTDLTNSTISKKMKKIPLSGKKGLTAV